MSAVRCPHCHTELPEKASFCAHCGRRIEPSVHEEATRRMAPTPSLLRAAAISVRKPASHLPLIISMLIVAVAGGFAGFFFVRARFQKKAPKPLAIAAPPPAPPPAPPSVPAPAPPTPTTPTAPTPPPLVRKSKSGKRAHVISSPPVAVKPRKHLAPGALPHKEVATDSKPMATAPTPTPPAPEPATDDKQQAQATLDADSVRLVVRQHLPQVRACYGRAFKDSSPGGAVEIGFAIDPAGRAKNVRTETNTTDSEPLAHCLEQRVREWQFPRPVGGDYELIYPFVFAPGT
jgi:hypothetical protein